MGIFNKATNMVEVMGKNVSKAAKDNMEIVKCSAAIETCEEKIKEMYQEIGKRYYHAEDEMTRDLFEDLFIVIKENEEQIYELKQRLHALKGVEVCKKCGAELKKGTNFCQWCGTPVDKPEYVQNSSSMTCPNCNSPLKGNEKFCIVCGTKLEELEQAETMSEISDTDKQQTHSCPACGELLKESDVFCENCGAAVK